MAGRIPEKFIDELLTRIDIVDVIDGRVPLKKAGKDYKACCPFHEEKTPSFTVSADKQFYHCFGCGVHGSAIGFLMEYDRMSFPEAVRELAGLAGVNVPEEAVVNEGAVQRSADLVDWLTRADHFYRQQLREHPRAVEAVKYLKDRGLSGEIAASFGMGYAPPGWDNLLKALGTDEAAREALLTAGLLVAKDNGGYYDRFRERVMFPIEDYRGRVVGFGGRVLGAGEPKYMNSPETPVFHKGREVYGLYRAREAIRREQRVLVVEGYMDVVALAQFGIDYVVATLGTATTRDHLERLFRFTPEVVFAFDGDRAGREAAWRAMENALPVMHEGRQASFLFLPDGEDPDSMVRAEGAEAFAERIKRGIPLGKYIIDTLASEVDLSRDDGRARLVELARPLISKLPEGVFRALMLDLLEKKSRIGADMLSKALRNPQKDPPIKGSGGAVSRKVRGPVRGEMSHMRRAIALLLMHPQAVAAAIGEAEQALTQALTQPGADLLLELLALLAANPDKTTGGIVEHFRESAHYAAVQKLVVLFEHAALERPAEEHDLGREFSDILRRLRRQEIEAALAALTDKGQMDADDKAAYQRLAEEIRGLKGG